jgi:hypothetical protein
MGGILDALPTTTIINYKYGAENSVIENNVVLKIFREKAKIKQQQGGTSLSGPIEAGRFAPFVSAPGEDMTAYVTPKQRWKLWTLDWADTRVATSVDLGLLRRNSGDQALVNIREVTIPNMWRDLLTNRENSLNGQMLNQNATLYSGTGLPFAGLATLLPGHDSQQTYAQAVTNYDLEGFNPTTGALTGAVPAVTDLEVAIGGAPTYQNYAGLSLKYNALTGVDGLVPDAWQPTLVNQTATAWGTTKPFLNATQYGIGRSARFNANDSNFMPDIGIMDFTSFQAMGTEMTSIQQVYLTPNGNSTNKFGTGFKANNMLYHAGLWFTWDQSMKANTTFILNLTQACMWTQPKLHTYGDQPLPLNKNAGDTPDTELIEVHYTYDPSTIAWWIIGLVSGQFFFHPRYQVRIGKYVP